MKIEDITDNDLRQFCRWFVDWQGCKPVAASILAACLTGYFSTYSKAADKLLARLKRLNLITMKGNTISLLS